MSMIAPFKAVRPMPELAAQLASKPYDVLNSKEARVEAGDNPISFLRITKSEIDLSEETDIHSVAVYEKAKENLNTFIEQGILFQEEKPCYYIYQLIMNGRSQTGLVCCSSVDDYFNDKIKKHEFTRPEKEKDRIDHMQTIGAQTGNVFLAYKNIADMTQLINSRKQTQQPIYNFTATDGIQHTLWVVNDDAGIENITQIFATQVPHTYIADGHHRAASAAKVSSAFPNSVNAQYFLTTIFPDNELAILDYNRIIKDLNGYTDTNFISALQEDFVITQSATAVKPDQLHEFGMYLNGKWYVLTAKDGTYTTDPIGVLDISILSENVLKRLLNIIDQRTDTRIDFVGGIRGLSELEKRVDSGEMKLAFSLYPVSLQQLFDIADSGNVMPPKSTWFEPKLRDGLLTHLI